MTGTQSATVVSLVGGQTAANVATATIAANAATNLNTSSTIVKRDASGNFNAGTITASLTGAASLNVLKTGDTMTGPLILSGGAANLTVGGTTTLSGHAAINGTTTFALGVPGIQTNVLQVITGTISGPNQFNSIGAAVAYAVSQTPSPTNRFVIAVGPGLFVESTITLQSYVSLVGSSPESTIIQASGPNQDVIVGASDCLIAHIEIKGASGTGYAGIRFHGGGALEVEEVEFDNCDICLYEDGTVGSNSFVLLELISIDPTSTFTTGIKIDGSGVNPVSMKIGSLTWLAQPSILPDTVIDITGPQATCVASSVDLGSSLLFGSTACKISNGAHFSLQSSTIRGFATGISVPNDVSSPAINIMSVYGIGNTTDISLLNPNVTGTVNGVFDRTKVVIDPAAQISLFLTDPVNQGTVTIGEQYVGDTFDVITNISPEIQQGANLGVIYGGDLGIIPATLQVTVSAGNGYLMVGAPPTDNLMYVTWATQTLLLPANQDNFIYIDNGGIAHSALSAPDELTTILIGKARTEGTFVAFTEHIHQDAGHAATYLDNSWRGAFGPIYASGSITTKNGNVQLDVSSGRYFYATHEYDPAGGTPISWYAFYRNGSGNYTIVSQSSVDYQQYDDGSGTLQPIPANQFAKHELFVVNDRAFEQYLLVYGQQLFTTLNDAQNGPLPNQPGSWTGNISSIAAIVVENTGTVANQISSILDERPQVGFKAGSSAGVTVHGDLSGLLADDHPQYLLTNGGRVLTGNLQMGGHNIVSAGTYNAVTVEAHASRHLPNGADPLTTAAPVTINTVNSIGSANSFSRSDHVHAHGSQTDPTLHAVATANPGGAAGFMSAADKTLLDSVNPALYVLKAGDTMTGDLAINAGGVNTFTVNTNKFVVNGGTGNTTVGGTLGVSGATTLSSLGTGVVHSNGSGLLSSSLIVNVDVDPAAGIVDTKLATISTALKVSNTATTATNANTASAIVARDGLGNFSAGTITAALVGNVTGNVSGSAASFTGLLAGDVTGTQGATVVSFVNGKTAAQVGSAVTDVQNATSSNTASAIVKRDASGNFSAGTITANLTGNATTATTATNFSGLLAGDVTGIQGATVVANVGGQTAANVATATIAANAATNLNTASTIVKRDASGNFSAGTITASLNGNALTATSATTATSFTGPLLGDVTGTQSATVVSLVGGQTAANVATATIAANAATNLNTASTIVKRDASGNFSAGTITANLTGNVTGSASLNVLKAGDTMTGALTMSNGIQLRLTQSGVGSNYIGFQAPASVPATYSLTFPATAGTANQVLSTSGTGILNWINQTSGSLPYYVNAYVGTNFTLPSNSTVTIPFDTENLDSNSNFNTITHAYTAPLTGIYYFGVNLSFQESGGNFVRIVQLAKNAVAQTGYSVRSNQDLNSSLTLTGVVSLAAGDVLTFNYAGRSADVIQANHTNVNIHLLSI
ncbi:MAG: hypothetical protein UW09_C0003G0227 [candidate division TM6 bacterium GW2011_GWF2_43_87]|nr:MAG: hypothetical protein UW09_C0003G0227 [candidate division TM6 bacterium GW2011_GWF2_43_87]